MIDGFIKKEDETIRFRAEKKIERNVWLKYVAASRGRSWDRISFGHSLFFRFNIRALIEFGVSFSDSQVNCCMVLSRFYQASDEV